MKEYDEILTANFTDKVAVSTWLLVSWDQSAIQKASDSKYLRTDESAVD